MAKLRIVPNSTQSQRELGFGRQVMTAGRMMNPDGSFNVRRYHRSWFDNVYYMLVTIPTWKFLLLTFSTFVCLNAIFAALYLLIGFDQLGGLEHAGFWEDYFSAFFFSGQTLTTVGYGNIHPVGVLASTLASLESFLGLLIFALISGLFYARFSRPVSRIAFSEKMLVAPYRETSRGLMFRMVNPSRSEMMEAEAQMILTLNQRDDATGEVARRFFALDLEISRITFFSMSWTIVHHINENSPLWGFSEQDLLDANAEIWVMVKGTDESTEQVVHARRSYTADEVVWNARFKPIMARSDNQRHTVVHTKKVSEHELVA